MSRAVGLVIDYVFNVLKVRKIEAGVYEGNIGSIKVLEKHGFVIEGTKRQHQMLKDGIILDSYIFGLLR